MKRCIKLILNALYGREYYAVIVGERGSDRYDLTSRIHHTAEELLQLTGEPTITKSVTRILSNHETHREDHLL